MTQMNVKRCKFFTRSFLLLMVIAVTACHYPHKEDRWVSADEHKTDSVAFREIHHYWCGENFVAVDSFFIQERQPDAHFAYAQDNNITVRKGDAMVVQEIVPDTQSCPGTYWIRITTVGNPESADAVQTPRNGWVTEKILLSHSVPDSPISRFIYIFSNQRLKLVMIFIASGLLLYILQAYRRRHIYLVYFHDINSFYPTLLCMIVAGAALLYQSLQELVPETWVEYYFHPTLNPLNPQLPFVMNVFLAAVWLIIFISIAVVDELRQLPNFTQAVMYVISLFGFCAFLYTVFTLLPPFPAGYVVLPLYWIGSILYFKLRQRPMYFCGFCGKNIPDLGKCPHCGAVNKRSLL